MNNVIEDHKAIRSKMEQVISYPSHNDLKRLSDIIYYHIRFEERTFLPHVEETLHTERLNAIEKVLIAHPANANTQWPDEFWRRKQYSGVTY